MKTEFMAAVTQLSSERNLPKEVILDALEAALASAYKKEAFSPEQDIVVRIDPEASDIRVYMRMAVADPITDPLREISLERARELRNDAQVGEIVEIESTPKGAGRIAAQIARQVVLQRLREAEHHAVYEQFVGREGEIVTGVIQFVQSNQIYVNLGKREALLPAGEQVPNERYHVGQQLRFYLLEISQGTRGPRILISRSHPSLVRRLFELEIPEVHSGVIELNAIAREAGLRSKVAVSSRQEGIEPVGCCLGPRGIRVQSIINQLNGEKIDVIQWHADPGTFISRALSPAQVASIELDEAERTATVVVPDKQLSLAIGKGGQNARLAAKLTGWRIDIKSVSAAEAEKASLVEPVAEPGKEEALPSIPLEGIQETEPAGEEIESTAEAAGEKLEVLLASEVFSFPPEAASAGQAEETQIRFAEDIMPDKRKFGTPAKGKTKAKAHRKRRVQVEDEEHEE